ncbi:MAG: AAA family ATPase [Candidatus Aminicenantes bacterium]|nr:AAA family ATPase [Candidatus Aminicenantes bacterium]
MGIFRKTKEEWFDLGGKHIDNGDFDKAVEAYHKALEIDNQDQKVWFNLGLSYHALEMLDDAYESFDMSTTIQPDYAEAFLQKGRVLSDQEKYRLAIKNFNKALEYGLGVGDELTANVVMADAYLAMQKFDEALPYYESALDLDDENVPALSGKAIIQYLDGEVEEALELIEEAKEIDPDDPYLAIALAFIDSLSEDENDDVEDDEDEDNSTNADSEKVKPTDKKEMKSKPSDEKNSNKPKKSFQRPENKKKESGPKGFACVAGMQEVKDILTKDIIEPLNRAEEAKKLGVSIPNGFLFFGPPGCGKTFIVRKLAEEIGYNYKEFSASDVGSKWAHETSGNIAKIFQEAADNAPTILFFDEIEALVPKRESLGSDNWRGEEINEFLTQMNNASEHKVLVIGATNKPDGIDDAIMRSGRMDKRVYIPPPDFDARKDLFRIHLDGRSQSKDINLDELAKKTDNYASSDIALIVNEAARKAFKDGLDELEQELMEYIIENTPSSLTKSKIDFYKSFMHLERK